MNTRPNKLVLLLAFAVFSASFLLYAPRAEAGFSSTSGTTGQSHAFTQTAGSNRIVVVSIAWESTGNQTDTVNTITYGGNAPSGSTAVAMNADGQPVTQYVVNYFWLESALPADGSRTATFTINNPGGGNQGFRTQVTQFNNMAQVVPSGSATASENDQSVDVTVSTPGSSVIMAVVHNTGATDATVGGSFAAGDEKWDVDTGDTRALGAVKDYISTGTFTGSWTGTVTRPATTVAVMAPVAPGIANATRISGTTSASGNFVLSGNSSRKVVVAVGVQWTVDGSSDDVTVSFNGTVMYLKAASFSACCSPQSSALIYYLDEASLPGAGTYNVTVTPGGTPNEVSANVIELYNAAQGPVDTISKNIDNANTDTVSTSITPKLSNTVIISVAAIGDTRTLTSYGSGQIPIGTPASTVATYESRSSSVADTQSFTWDTAGIRKSIISVAFSVIPTGIYANGFDTTGSSANSGTDTISVPAGTTVALVYWTGWLTTHTLNMSSLSVGGQAMTILQNGTTNSPDDGLTAGGVAILINPPTGDQTFAWDWSGSNTLEEGALFSHSFFATSIAPQSNADVLVDSDIVRWFGEDDQSVTLDSTVGGYVQGMVQSYSCSTFPDGAPGGSNQIVDTDNQSNNCEAHDIAHEATVSSTSTTFSGHGDYGVLVAVSLKDIAALLNQPIMILNEE